MKAVIWFEMGMIVGFQVSALMLVAFFLKYRNRARAAARAELERYKDEIVLVHFINKKGPICSTACRSSKCIAARKNLYGQLLS